jgi:hypothetical protein
MEATDLYGELQNLNVDVGKIAYLVALVRHRNRQRKKILDERAMEKNRINDALKKIKKRHPHPESFEHFSNRKSKILNSYMTQLVRKSSLSDSRNVYLGYLVNEKTGLRFPAKTIPTLGLDVCCIESVLSLHTRAPYRYIAAIFNVFNLRPENACSACRQFDTKAKKCKYLTNIFGTDCHSTTRRALWQIGNKTKKMYHPDLIERLRESIFAK